MKTNDITVQGEKVLSGWVYLRTINRYLRWTGRRLFIGVDIENINDPEKRTPAKIGFLWHGWGFIKELDQDLVRRNE